MNTLSRSVAVAVLLAFTPIVARGQVVIPGPVATPTSVLQVIFTAPVAAPDVYAKASWKFGEQLTPGYWFTEQAVIHIDEKARYLTEQAATACVDAQIKASKPTIWLIVLGAVLGVAAGVLGAKAL